MWKVILKYCLVKHLLTVASVCISFSGHSQNFPSLTITIEDTAATQGYYFRLPIRIPLPIFTIMHN